MRSLWNHRLGLLRLRSQRWWTVVSHSTQAHIHSTSGSARPPKGTNPTLSDPPVTQEERSGSISVDMASPDSGRSPRALTHLTSCPGNRICSPSGSLQKVAWATAGQPMWGSVSSKWLVGVTGLAAVASLRSLTTVAQNNSVVISSQCTRKSYRNHGGLRKVNNTWKCKTAGFIQHHCRLSRVASEADTWALIWISFICTGFQVVLTFPPKQSGWLKKLASLQSRVSEQR